MSADFDFDSFLESYVADLTSALSVLPKDAIRDLYLAVCAVIENGGTVHFIGNGGSAATPSHSAGDWAKELSLRTICHVDNVASLTAWANDTSYDNVFVGALETWARPGDLVVGYSGSGNSANVLNGIEYAREAGCITACITGDYRGGGGGALAGMVDVAVVCDTTSMERIEDLQLVINHIVKEAVKATSGAGSQ